MRNRTCYLLCLLPLVQTSCLTRALWADAMEIPPLKQSSARCRVHAVRGDFLAAGPRDATAPLPHPTAARGPLAGETAPGTVDVTFSVEREYDTATELQHYTPEHQGVLRLRPPPAEENWFRLPGAQLFEPKVWEMRAFRASYFHEPTASIPVTWAGKLSPAQLGTLHRSEDAPAAWKHLPPLPPGRQTHELLRDSLAAFGSHDWLRLLRGDKVFSDRDTKPLAWIDDQGKILAPEEMQRRLLRARARSATAEELSGYTLLGRLDGAWGDPLYVRVPLPVLVQGSGLKLTRLGDTVLWRREQVWRATVQPVARATPLETPVLDGSDRVGAALAASRPARAIPMVSRHFRYTYAEVDDGNSVLGTLFRVLLTPPAFVGDFILSHWVGYAEILKWLHGHDQKWQGPIGPDKKK